MDATPPSSPLTDTGVGESLLLPSPSWPAVPLPQHQTAPALVTAHVCEMPPATVLALPADAARAPNKMSSANRI
jgi:hypothetical protein